MQRPGVPPWRVGKAEEAAEEEEELALESGSRSGKFDLEDGFKSSSGPASKLSIGWATRWTARQFYLIDQQATLSRGPPDWRILVNMLTCVISLLSLNYGEHMFWGSHLPRPGWMKSDRLWSYTPFIVNCLFSYFVMPACVVKLVYRQPLSSVGFSARGFGQHWPLYLGLLSVSVVGVTVVSVLPEFQARYPFIGKPESVRVLLVWELMYAAQFVALEFFFRGFMIHGLKHRYGHASVWVMTLPYLMLHNGKPLLESFSSAFGGTLLGLVSLSTNSILGGCFLHIGIAWTADLAVLTRKGVWATMPW